ncbi:MAG: RecX family transcriptional regulator [Caldilineales bacterium]|nr:RecX family transcriptional regulator [Caldilineales bacterium]
MPGTITRLAYQKKNQQRVSVYLDDEFAFGLPDIEAAQLRVGQTLDDREIERLRLLAEVSLAVEQAVRLLTTRPRSESEIATNLRQRGHSPQVCERAIAQLNRLGYLDDRAFANWWIDNRTRFSPRGHQALRYELRQKGIAPELIEAVLADIDADSQAVSAARQRAERWRNLPKDDFDKKMLGFLQRRGFNYADARAATEQTWQELQEDFQADLSDDI